MCSWFLLVVIILWPVFPQLFHASRTFRFRFRGKFEGICGRGDAGGFGNYSCFRQNINWAISGLFEALVYLLQTISLFYYYPFFISCNKSFSMYIRRKWSTSRLSFHPKTITPSFRSGEGEEETARGTNRAEAKERTALSAQSSPATGARLRPKERPGCRLIRSIDCSSWKFAICNSAHRCFFLWTLLWFPIQWLFSSCLSKQRYWIDSRVRSFVVEILTDFGALPFSCRICSPSGDWIASMHRGLD